MRCQPSDKHEVYIWLKNTQYCLLCDERGESHVPICVPCETELPWLDTQCERCALPLPAFGLCCPQCQKRPPGFTQVVVPWRYDFPVDSLITRFKHNGKWPMGRLLAELCGQFVQHRLNEGLARPDSLIPVPLANRRFRQRGYNQAAMLADWLGRQLHLPVDEHNVLRSRETPAQQGLDARARRRNLRDAFTLTDPERVRGKHLALVDDVLTTGSTAEVIARMLLRAGASRVDVYCLARTPRPDD